MEHVSIISHDAGGAEILSSWLNRVDTPASVVLSGPAVSIFQRKCPHAKVISLDEALATRGWLLCGTGWQSHFELRAIARGRALGKRTVAFLDHWVNYRERFTEGSVTVLPDEIWVGDRNAERIARCTFDQTPVILKPNPYFEDLLLEIEAKKTIEYREQGLRILYVCEPVSDHAVVQYGNARYWGYTEQDALRFFLRNVAALGEPIETITIRPHPSEGARKYCWANTFSLAPVRVGCTDTLVEEVVAADIVVGCESMAMVVGLIAGKRVISSIPPGGRSCRLPHSNIEHMQELVRDLSRDG